MRFAPDHETQPGNMFIDQRHATQTYTAGWLTLAGRLKELLWRLLLGGKELLKAVHGHLGVHQLRDQLRQLEQGHPQHLHNQNNDSAIRDDPVGVCMKNVIDARLALIIQVTIGGRTVGSTQYPDSNSTPYEAPVRGLAVSVAIRQLDMSQSRTHREEGERCEGLRGGELVAQEDVDAEGEHRDEHGDGVEGEAEQGLDDEAAPQRAQLLVAHALDAVPHGPLHASTPQLSKTCITMEQQGLSQDRWRIICKSKVL